MQVLFRILVSGLHCIILTVTDEAFTDRMQYIKVLLNGIEWVCGKGIMEAVSYISFTK
jgi:hypothetical protein